MPGAAKRAIRTLLAVYAAAQLLQGTQAALEAGCGGTPTACSLTGPLCVAVHAACSSHWLGVLLLSAAAVVGAHVVGQHYQLQLRRPSSSTSHASPQQQNPPDVQTIGGVDDAPRAARQGPYVTPTTPSSSSPGPGVTNSRGTPQQPTTHTADAHADPSAAAAAGGGVVRDHGAWRAQVGSEEVADAWELLAGSIVQEVRRGCV
jgi:hypothetical protein